MSLKDFVIQGRDKFEPSDEGHLDFPCCACKHRHGPCTDEPCRTCDHNIGAAPDRDQEPING